MIYFLLLVFSIKNLNRTLPTDLTFVSCDRAIIRFLGGPVGDFLDISARGIYIYIYTPETTWKWMVGRWSFPFGIVYFQVRSVSFREDIYIMYISNLSMRPFGFSPGRCHCFGSHRDKNGWMHVPWPGTINKKNMRRWGTGSPSWRIIPT